jgi:hypothetical protein
MVALATACAGTLTMPAVGWAWALISKVPAPGVLMLARCYALYLLIETASISLPNANGLHTPKRHTVWCGP